MRQGIVGYEGLVRGERPSLQGVVFSVGWREVEAVSGCGDGGEAVEGRHRSEEGWGAAVFPVKVEGFDAEVDEFGGEARISQTSQLNSLLLATSEYILDRYTGVLIPAVAHPVPASPPRPSALR